MDCVLLVSSAAGSTEDEAVAAVRAVLGGEVVETAERADLDRVLDRLDGRRLVVCGGDGSLHVTVQALHERGELAQTDLALVPLGTGNDFARTLGLPLEPAEAAVRARYGGQRRLDLVVDDRGGVVVNAVHAGVGALASEQATALKPRLGPAAYLVGAVRAGLSRARWRLRVEIDGRVVHDGPVLQAGFGVGSSIGGGTPFAPDADPADGLVDVVVSTATGPLARLGYAAALRRGSQSSRDDVRVTRGRHVSITALTDTGLNADGELEQLAAGRSRSWTVQPKVWSLRV